jgi:hypothetical protein
MSNGVVTSYPNLIQKRQNLAASLVYWSAAFVDALNTLAELQAQRANLSEQFTDQDFQTGIPITVNGTPVRIDHLSAYLTGAIFDFGLAPMVTAYKTVPTGGQAPQNYLEQARM